MLEKAGSEFKTHKLLPLSSNPRLSWVEWKGYLLRKQALTTSFIGAAKVTRLARYAMANALLVMDICHSTMYCDEARAVVTAFQFRMEVQTTCTNYLRLDYRESNSNSAKVIGRIKTLLCGFGETTCQISDRQKRRTGI